MVSRTRFYLVLSLAILLPGIIITTYKNRQLNTVSKSITISDSLSSSMSPNSHWTLWLQEQEKQIWDELTTTTKLSFEQCKTLKKEWYADYLVGEEKIHTQESKPTPISRETHDTINAIMGDFGISTKELPLLAWKENSAAGTTDTKLLVNERVFNKLSRAAQKFVIAHEIQHFLHKDTSTRYVIERFYKPGKNLTQTHPLNKFYRFQEVRADVQAALKGTEYQQGYIDFIETIAKKGENQGITHPKHSLRLSMGKKLINNAPTERVII